MESKKCQNPECDQTFERRIDAGGMPERIEAFRRRKYCSLPCASRGRSLKAQGKLQPKVVACGRPPVTFPELVARYYLHRRKKVI